MKNKRYFEEALGSVTESFFNAGGDFEFSNENVNAAGSAGDLSSNMNPSAPTSQPYIVNVTNTTGAAIANVFVLGAFTNVTGVANYGNPIGIQITYGLPNVSYQEFLYQSMTKPFKVGLTYLQSVTAGQVLATVAIQHKDANGNLAVSPMVPIIDPYQYQTTVIGSRLSYTVDGYTLVTISSIAAGAAYAIYFYPSEKVDLRRAVAGLGASTPYSAPRVMNQQKLSISAPTAAALGNL